MVNIFIHLLLLASTFLFVQSQAEDTMTYNKTLSGNQTLISAGKIFALSFTNIDDSTNNKYLAIWYYQVPLHNVVWTPNITQPIKGSSGLLRLTEQGNLMLFDGNQNLWSTGTSNASNPILQLLDSGNLVLKDGSSNNVLWQSFDYPGNTYLSSMRLGVDFTRNLTMKLTSWTTAIDPSPGEYTTGVETQGVPELYTWKNSVRIWRSGPWTGEGIKINPYLSSSGMFKLEYYDNKSGIFFSVQTLSTSIVARVLLNTSGVLEAFLWPYESESWTSFATFPTDQCDNFASCGANGVCTFTNQLFCKCIPGFSPNSPQKWVANEYSDGCEIEKEFNCTSDGFWLLQSVKLPATLHAKVDVNKSLNECKSWCLSDCSCTAYAVSGSTGCLVWTGNLMDIKTFTQSGENLFVRLNPSTIEFLLSNSSVSSHSGKKKIIVPIIAAIFGGGLLLTVFFALLCFKRKPRNDELQLPPAPAPTMDKEDKLELPLFNLATIKEATKEFSIHNKLGEGGFGPVYKGILQDGRTVAVKRLSKESVQGLQEFKTEVSLIANVQHKNLVRLLGCCVDLEERILVYEFMQNGSLDSFIFDKEKSVLLNFQQRLDIIVGIARGLLYLHQDSRLKIIHRDLKAGNVLLDEEINPKISDFGMARVLKENQIKESTVRVVGTYGYMAPEYVVGGIFSEKSDIFSFGVLVLEIISSRRGRVINQSTDNVYFLGYAWKLWKENRCSELLANVVDPSCDTSQVARFIQVGLLCVQESPNDRPTMFDVVMMLNSKAILLPQPKQPGFFTVGNFSESSGSASAFSNEATMTLPHGR